MGLMLGQQGVVTYILPIEAFVTGIENLDWQKITLDRLIISSKSLDCLIHSGSKVTSVAPPLQVWRLCPQCKELV